MDVLCYITCSRLKTQPQLVCAEKKAVRKLDFCDFACVSHGSKFFSWLENSAWLQVLVSPLWSSQRKALNPILGN